MKENSFDVEKFGFTLARTSENGMLFYEKKMSSEYVLSVQIAADVFTVYYTRYDSNGEWDYEIKVANRYKVYTQEQLDFLILNGRIGHWFKSSPILKNN